MRSPLVSCLCVTRGSLDLARECFAAQTYPNLELVIVQGSPEWPELHLKERELEVLTGPEPLTLGARRNLGARAARGAYIAVWDDDDWHAPDRIEHQMEHMHGFANVLDQIGIYDQQEHEAYAVKRFWENTLLIPRDKLLRHPYTQRDRGEDTDVINKLQALGGGIGKVPTNDAVRYVYSIHGTNCWPREHYGHFFRREDRLQAAEADRFAELLQLRSKLSEPQ